MPDSRAVALLAAEELGPGARLMGDTAEQRELVLQLVDLHYSDCLIEQLSMTVMVTKNKVRSDRRTNW